MKEQGVQNQVRGQVQGVGFRPFVWRLARERGLRGQVWNDPEGVGVELFGEIGDFLAALRAEAPPLARIDVVEGRLSRARRRRGSRSRRRAGMGRRRGWRPMRRVARSVWPRASGGGAMRAGGGPVMPSPIAPIAGRGFRSCGVCPMIGARRRWRGLRCAPTVGRNMKTPLTGAFMRSRSPARFVGRGSGMRKAARRLRGTPWRWRRRRSGRERSSRSRG